MKTSCVQINQYELHLTMTPDEAESLREIMRRSLECEMVEQALSPAAISRNIIRNNVIEAIGRVF